MTYAARMAGETQGAPRREQRAGQDSRSRDALRETARINSYTEPTNVLSAADAGNGTATITMAAHKRVYPVQGVHDVPDLVLSNPVALTGAPLGTAGFVYYDDPTLLNVTPTLVFTTVQKEAQVGYAAGRHLVGSITTPAAGGTATSGGGGSLPPGGGGGGALP